VLFRVIKLTQSSHKLAALQDLFVYMKEGRVRCDVSVDSSKVTNGGLFWIADITF
jgi:hypothetical protein